ncbi:MAG: aminoglycoside 6-N-acetyltransferase [Thermoleophilaceae bacterium]|jgi:aminoglycoside 6'-N-acetyltransferase|nr:aminoglycoside 6-N-acetyltransferase [Thermoleophilaceae bacterium]
MTVPVLQGERVSLKPIGEADLEPLAAIIREPGVAEWWGESDEPERLRDNLRMDGDAWAIEHEGELAGWLGFTEETEPEYRSVGLDISLSNRFQGQGLGPEALRTAIRWFAEERGHHRFTIDPSVQNERAISAYAKVGFRPIGVMRRAELIDGEWTDALLMDLLIEELT